MRTEATSADQRTPLIVVSGLQQEQVREVASFKALATLPHWVRL